MQLTVVYTGKTLFNVETWAKDVDCENDYALDASDNELEYLITEEEKDA